MDSTLFETWFASQLLPSLAPNTMILMDNACFHRKSILLNLVESAGFCLVFLPPYSPELNSIENFWSWLKRHLRKPFPFTLLLMLLFVPHFRFVDYTIGFNANLHSFNSRPRVGGDSRPFAGCMVWFLFQFPPPRRGRPRNNALDQFFTNVSIPASAWGATTWKLP